MELNLVLPWGCLSYRVLLNVALEPSESYSCCSGNVCWWAGEMLNLVLYFHFLLVTYHYLLLILSTYSPYQPTVATGCSGPYLLIMGWTTRNFINLCQPADSAEQPSGWSRGGVRFRAPVRLVTRPIPATAVHPACRKYKITAGSSRDRCQKHV